MCPQKNKSSEPNFSDNCQAQSDPDMICSVRKIIVCYQKARDPFMRPDTSKGSIRNSLSFAERELKERAQGAVRKM